MKKIILLAFIVGAFIFNVNAQVSLITPGSTSGGVIYPDNLNLTFQWTNSGADHRVQIARDDGTGGTAFTWSQSEGFIESTANIVYNENVGNNTTLNYTVIRGKSYAWSVKDANSLLYSNRFYFVVAVDPPALISPTNNETVTSPVTCTWNSIPDATAYRIHISMSSSFDEITGLTDPSICNENVGNLTSKTKNLSPGTYYWTVKGATEVSVSPFAEVRSFTVEGGTGSYNLELTGNISVIPDPLQYNESADFEATVTNSGDADFTGEIYMAWHNADGTYITDLDSEENLTEGSSHTLSYSPSQISSPVGSYKVVIKYTENYSDYITLGEKTVIVEDCDGEKLYKLPFPEGTSYTVSRTTEHGAGDGYYAIDFAMSMSSEIVATRAGTVTHSTEYFPNDNCPYPNCDDCLNDVNRVVIDHGDGESTLYLHLTENGSLVTVGQYVEQGEVIGYSGNSGCSSGPHLHFQVQETGSSWWEQSVQAYFDDVATDCGILQSGETYTSGNTTDINTTKEEQIEIYPNPTKNILNITNTKDVKSVQLFSITGQIIFDRAYKNSQNQISISTQLLQNGVYILKIKTNENSFAKQIIINK